MLDPALLCISPGHAVWAIYIDVVCINYDGNAFDAAVLAVMAALRNSEDVILPRIVDVSADCETAKLPRAIYDPRTSKTRCVRGDTYPLGLGRIPLSCSLGIFQS